MMRPSQKSGKSVLSRSAMSLLSGAAVAGIGAFAAPVSAANTPVALTGWNQDLIAENTNGLTATSSPFDVPNNYIFYVNGVVTGGAGLPSGGSFTSASNSSTTFLFQPYNASNALFFNNQSTANGATLNTTGKLTLANTTAFTSLAFLVAAANGTSTLTYTLNFANGQTLPETMTVNDWFNATPYAITSLGREKRLNPLSGGDNTTSGSGNPRMYEVDLNLPAADQSYGLSSISFTQTGGNTAAVFAVSGAVSASTVYFAGNVSGSVNGNFDTSTPNFLTGDGTGSSLAFANGNAAIFDDTASTGTVTVANGGVQPYSLTFNNNSLAYTFGNGPITGGGGGVFFNGSSSVRFNDAATFPGGATLNNGTVTIGSTGAFNASSINVASGATLTYLSGATAPGTFTLLGTGTVNVNGTALAVGGNTNFNGSFGGTGGSLNLSAGTVTLQNASSAAAFSNGVTVASGASLQIGNNDTNIGLTTGSPVTVTISGVGLSSQNVSGGSGIGALTTVGSGTATFNGNVVLASAATISPAAFGTLNLNGNISGTGPLTLAGNSGSNLLLAGNNTYTGGTIVTGEPGLLPSSTNIKLGSNGGLSPNGGLVVNGGVGGTSVDLNGFSPSVTYLAGSVGVGGSTTITNNGSVPSVLTISNGNTSSAAANAALTLADGSSTLAILKTGPGTQILSGNNTYSGGTTVKQGTLSVATASALGSSSGVVTLSGGTLAFGSSTPNLVPVLTGFGSFAPGQGYLLRQGNAPANPVVNGGTLQLTPSPAVQGVNASIFTAAPQSLNLTSGFQISYSFTENSTNSNYAPDGAALVIQNDPRGTAAIGDGGGALGYGGNNATFTPITNSVALGFGVYSYYFGGGGANDIYFGTNGSIGGVATSGESVLTQTINVTVTYNGSAHTLTQYIVGANGVTDTNTFTANLSTLLNGSSGYIGFTAGLGDGAAVELVKNFTYSTYVNGPISVPNPIVAAANTSSTIQSAVATGYTTQGVGPVTINSGATIALVATSTLSAPRLVLATPSVTFTAANAVTGVATSGTLNLNSNDLDITSQPLSAVTALVAGGYNITGGGNWAGPGITSTLAASSSTHLLAVGVIQNNQGASGQPIYSSTNTFDGAAPGSSDVLVKLTYFGDANLDGKVDGSDYSLIDNGYASRGTGSPLSGWYNGDFNYDGVIDGSDYALIDNSFNNQGSPENISTSALTATSTAQAAIAPAAVPEPASIAMMAFATTAVAARRRRR